MSEVDNEPMEKSGDEWGIPMRKPEAAKEPCVALVERSIDPFSMMDALDDSAILDELEGRITEVASYHFHQDGKEIWGLAKVGVDWAVQELSKKGFVIRDEELAYAVDPTDPTYLFFTAKVGKYFVDKSGIEAKVDTAIGTKRQWTKLKRRDSTITADPFFFEKGSMKAIRNARMRLIPEETKAAIIALAKQGGRIKEVKPQTARTEEEGLKGAATANVAPSPTKPMPKPAAAKPEAKPQAQITLTMSNGKLWTGGYPAALEYFAKIRKELGDKQYYSVLDGHGYEHSNQIPYVGMDQVFGELIMTWRDKVAAEEPPDAEPFPEKY